MTLQSIELTAEQALAIVKTQLPLIETFIPQVGAAAGAITLGVTAAEALIPLLEKIPVGETLSVDEQASLFSRVNGIVDGSAFAGAEWAPSAYAAHAATVTATSNTTDGAASPAAATEQPAPGGNDAAPEAASETQT